MNQLTVIERENQRVMTTAVLAEEYATTTQAITNNFNRNKERYIEGKHFYCLEGDEKREFINQTQIDLGSKNASKLYLWTEKGALLHAKSLGTDRAWEVYEILVDTYFKKHDLLLDGMSTEMKAILMHDRKLQEVQQDVKLLKNTMTVDHGQAREIECIRKSRAATILGGIGSDAYNKLGSKVFRAIGHDYKEFFNINAYSNTPVAKFAEAKHYLKNWVPDNNLQLLINAANRGDVV